MPKIIHVTSLKPFNKYTTDQIVKKADQLWLSRIDPSIRRAALKIFNSSEIDERYSVESLDVVFGDLTFEQKNDLYKAHMVDMGTRVLKKALEESNVDPSEIGFLITTSCTGFMIPSVDAYIVNNLNLNQNIQRLPVTEMGCAGGTSALIYANQFSKANPKMKIAIVSVEIPSLTFQKNDFSMENLVSTAIFADGASCVIIGDTDQVRPEIIDTDMYHFKDTQYLMGYNLQNSGLKIVLDRDVPDKISEHFPKFFFPFLEKNKLKVEDVNHYMFHPGGKKIINRTEDFIGRYGKDISDSKNILKKHGNMSSSTILHILELFMKKNPQKGDLGYMLAFGPGFIAQSLLLKWQ